MDLLNAVGRRWVVMIVNAVTMGLVAALAWGIHDFAVRLAGRAQPLMVVLLSVLFFGMVFQLLLIVFTGGLAPVSGAAVWLSLIAGLWFLVAAICLYVAFQRGPVKLVAPIIGSYPIISLLLASLNGSPSSLFQWVAVGAILAGITIVALTSDAADTGGYTIGPTIAVSGLAAVSFALTFAFGQSAAAMADERLTIAITRLVALGLLLAALLVKQQPILPDLKTLPLLAFMGLMDTVALFCVLSTGGLDNAHFAAAVSSIFGLITVLLSWLFLRETLSLLQWGGVVVTFCGIGYLAL
jgi:drug/metabolite transporter (DMT)-like permease